MKGLHLLLVLSLTLGMVPSAGADDATDGATAAAISVVSATPAAVLTHLTAIGGGAVLEGAGLAGLSTIMALGIWREIVTNPAKRGLYRYAWQPDAAGEYRKWAKPTGRWRDLAAYREAGGEKPAPFVAPNVRLKYQRVPGSAWMQRVS